MTNQSKSNSLTTRLLILLAASRVADARSSALDPTLALLALGKGWSADSETRLDGATLRGTYEQVSCILKFQIICVFLAVTYGCFLRSYVQNLLSTIKDQRRKLQDHDSGMSKNLIAFLLRFIRSQAQLADKLTFIESVASAEHSSHAGAQSPSRNSETTAKKPSPQEVPLTPGH